MVAASQTCTDDTTAANGWVYRITVDVAYNLERWARLRRHSSCQYVASTLRNPGTDPSST